MILSFSQESTWKWRIDEEKFDFQESIGKEKGFPTLVDIQGHQPKMPDYD